MQSTKLSSVPLDDVAEGDGEGGGEAIDGLGGVFAGAEEGVVGEFGGGFDGAGDFAGFLEEGVGVWDDGEVVEFVGVEGEILGGFAAFGGFGEGFGFGSVFLVAAGFHVGACLLVWRR